MALNSQIYDKDLNNSIKRLAKAFLRIYIHTNLESTLLLIVF